MAPRRQAPKARAPSSSTEINWPALVSLLSTSDEPRKNASKLAIHFKLPITFTEGARVALPQAVAQFPRINAILVQVWDSELARPRAAVAGCIQRLGSDPALQAPLIAEGNCCLYLSALPRLTFSSQAGENDWSHSLTPLRRRRT